VLVVISSFGTDLCLNVREAVIDMLFSKILVSYDDSDLSKKALQKAADLARIDESTELDVLNVVTVPTNQFIVGDVYREVRESTLKYGHEVVNRTNKVLDELPNATHTFVKEGQPVRTILDFASQDGYDLIIIGSRGLSGVKEFLGSVSHGVVQRSKIPVLIIK
jgi:nucleotide-binding universal stress UspA family protein